MAGLLENWVDSPFPSHEIILNALGIVGDTLNSMIMDTGPYNGEVYTCTHALGVMHIAICESRLVIQTPVSSTLSNFAAAWIYVNIVISSIFSPK